MEDLLEAPNNRVARSRKSSSRNDEFAEFDRARFMFVRTTGGITLWNRSLSMLGNGYRPSAVALHLYQNFGVRIGEPCLEADPERDQGVIDYFARLVIPDDAIVPVSIFDEHGGQA
jgi:hypothetical protein